MKAAPAVSCDVAVTEAFEKVSRKPRPKRKPAPRLTLRLTEDEMARLKEAAGHMALSAYARSRLFGPDVTHRKIRLRAPIRHEAALARALGLLGQSDIARNLSVLAQEARSGSLLLDEQTYTQIEHACMQVSEIRCHIVQALGLREGGAP